MYIAIVGARPPTILGRDDSYGAFQERVCLHERILQDVDVFVDSLPPGTIVVSGGAPGVDRRAVARAKLRGLEYKEYLPKYFKYGPKQAPLERNKEIVLDSDEVHAWPAPWSRGTIHALDFAEGLWVPSFRHTVK
jgi:hypothetical protein